MHTKTKEPFLLDRLLSDVQIRQGLFALIYFDLKKFVGNSDDIRVDELLEYARQTLMLDINKVAINKDFTFDDKPRLIISAILPSSIQHDQRKHYHALFRLNETGGCGRTGALDDEESIEDEIPLAFRLKNNI